MILGNFSIFSFFGPFFTYFFAHFRTFSPEIRIFVHFCAFFPSPAGTSHPAVGGLPLMFPLLCQDCPQGWKWKWQWFQVEFELIGARRPRTDPTGGEPVMDRHPRNKTPHWIAQCLLWANARSLPDFPGPQLFLTRFVFTVLRGWYSQVF